MLSLLRSLIGLALAILIVGSVRTWQVNHGEQEKVFLGGSVPSPRPEGLYAGTVPGHTFSWKGKKFASATSTGINVFDDGGGTLGERYPFATSVGKGITDTNLDVLKIEYNISGNPWWLRLILDEIVQVAPGQYLGKLQLRIIPGYPFTLGYFELKK